MDTLDRTANYPNCVRGSHTWVQQEGPDGELRGFPICVVCGKAWKEYFTENYDVDALTG